MSDDVAGVPVELVVVGSINQDYFACVDVFPALGETALADRGALGRGGKGADQAVAAAVLGTRVALIGAVGSDFAGQAALMPSPPTVSV